MNLSDLALQKAALEAQINGLMAQFESVSGLTIDTYCRIHRDESGEQAGLPQFRFKVIL